jgi:cysteine desulfurase
MVSHRVAAAGRMTYLDYQATTPLAPEVKAAMTPWLDQFANPHSPSTDGRRAAAAIEVARSRIVDLFPAKGQLSFTSGATEALNWALKGLFERSKRRKFVTVATEHAAVLDSADWLEGQGIEVVRLPVGPDGLVDLNRAEAAIDDRTALVAVMLVNNEIGVIQPVEAIASLAHQRGALFLCDAVQGFGRVSLPQSADFIAISAHKIHGPKGIGALWVRDGITLDPLLHGGAQEKGGRSGTLSPMLCAGFGEAARLMQQLELDDAVHIASLWTAALAELGPAWILNGSAQARYQGNLNLRREGLDAARLLSDCRDIAFSLGSACASGSGRLSHVLRAIGLSDREARSSIRLGFGRYTTEKELIVACGRLNESAVSQRVAS